LIIAIDGPGSAGKSTVARMLAGDLGFLYIDTGAMYRAVALAVIRRGIGTDDEGAVAAALDQIAVSIDHDPATGEQIVYLGVEDVSALIRSPEMSIGASDVSRIPAVRLRLVDLQRKIAEGRDVILDGRDIGTFVFPNAEKKFFLTASAETRAERRWLELRAKGEDVSYDECLRDLNYRDHNDSARAFAPLAMAEDALCVKTDGMTAREAADLIRSHILDGGGGHLHNDCVVAADDAGGEHLHNDCGVAADDGDSGYYRNNSGVAADDGGAGRNPL